MLRALERVLIVIGIASLGYYGYVSAETALYQAYESRELDAILANAAEHVPAAAPAADRSAAMTADAAAPASAPAAPRRIPAPGSVVGKIEIPRLGISAVVRAGSDDRTLRLAVGHIPGTALPGEAGNVGFAAHRDTFFRPLGQIQAGDEVRVVTPEGTFTYIVAGTNIVDPTEVWVLDPTDEPTVTLVTCYPFAYIGSAPQRFIVRAHLAAE